MSRHASLSNDITHQNTGFHWFLKSHDKRRYITFSLERWNFLLHTQHSRIFARLTRWQSPTNYCIVTRDNNLLYSTKYWYALVDNRRFSREVIAAMLVDENKRSLISFFCSSTRSRTFLYCYGCLWNLVENVLLSLTASQ